MGVCTLFHIHLCLKQVKRESREGSLIFQQCEERLGAGEPGIRDEPNNGRDRRKRKEGMKVRNRKELYAS